MVEDALTERLMGRAQRLYAKQAAARSWQEVEKLIGDDPELFERCLKRASDSRYAGCPGGNGPTSLWIACNLVESLRLAPWCYYCGKTLTRDEFMRGHVHLEHFEPRSHEGTHEPGNIRLACRQCNLLKSSLTDDDMVAILENPDGFFRGRSWSRTRVRQLEEFAEIYYPRTAGLSGYADRQCIRVRDARNHWEQRREQYRAKWQAPN